MLDACARPEHRLDTDLGKIVGRDHRERFAACGVGNLELRPAGRLSEFPGLHWIVRIRIGEVLDITWKSLPRQLRGRNAITLVVALCDCLAVDPAHQRFANSRIGQPIGLHPQCRELAGRHLDEPQSTALGGQLSLPHSLRDH